MSLYALLRTASVVAATLPAGSPLRVLVAYQIQKYAAVEDDLFARLSIIEGALKRPRGSMLRGSLRSQMSEVKGAAPQIDAEWLDLRHDFKFYEVVLRAAQTVKSFRMTPEEIAANLVVGMTFSGKETDSIYRQLGKAHSDEILNGQWTPNDARRALSGYARRKALDVLKLKRDVLDESDSLDAPVGGGGEGFDLGRMLSEMLAGPGGLSVLETVFDLPEGRKVLQALDGYLDSKWKSPGQKAVWDIVKVDPDLIKDNITSIQSSKLAQDIAEMTGKEISAARAGQIWRDVLDILQATSAEHPELFEQIESLQEMSRTRMAKVKNHTAADRSLLVRLASTLPVGSPERKAILAGLAPASLNIGDILYGSWGYDQTNASFYEVVRATGMQVVVRELENKVVQSSPDGVQTKVVPVPGKFKNEPPLRRGVKPDYAGKPSVKINSYLYVRPWDGRPASQTYTG